jgi:hypothetical protein
MDHRMIPGKQMGSHRAGCFETGGGKSGILKAIGCCYPREIVDYANDAKCLVIHIFLGNCIHIFDRPA